MRGLHTLLLSRGPGPGFIPARAGSAAGSVELRAYPPVHPRPCGVCLSALEARLRQEGSSPLRVVLSATNILLTTPSDHCSYRSSIKL